ncbi:MAG: Phosphate transporter family protein [Candidatus Methanolliviera sp. GoM_oil]|nr:MAG: Phosphate transporter family protein [Candidatus Methanolliviera sp. GoM_oil]
MLLIAIILLVGLYMAWNIGANDLANSMADVVGSGVLPLRRVILYAGIADFLGAVIFGSRVTKTVAKGIIPIEMIDPHLALLGLLSATFAAASWVMIATYFELPVSTSHSVVGAMLGFGLFSVFKKAIEFNQIEWGVLVKIVSSWVLSPVAGALVAFLLLFLIRKFLIERSKDINRLERIFGYLLIASSCYIAFSHGSNDVANAIGPVAAAVEISNLSIPLRALTALGGVGIVIGVATWGYKVIETVGTKITNLVPSSGFAADISTASVVLFCSYLGLPVSTTHTLVGSIVGVGLSKGISAVNLGVVKEIVMSWLITIPIPLIIAFGLSGGLVYLGV